MKLKRIDSKKIDKNVFIISGLALVVLVLIVIVISMTSNYSNKMDESNKKIEELSGTVDSLQSEIDIYRGQIEDKDSKIKELSDTIDKLNKDVQEKDKEISNLSAVKAQKNKSSYGTYRKDSHRKSTESSGDTRSYSGQYRSSSSSSGVLTASSGVNHYNGRTETYYSQKVLPGGGLNIPGRHVADDGTVRDADGYICVASNDVSYGSTIETSLGTGKVYDSGCASGVVDIYTNW